MNLHMVRHGQTAGSRENRFTGSSDPPMTAVGEAMAEDGLKEIAYGEWEGLRQDEVKERWPAAFEYWAADVASRGTPGGETAFHVAARAMRVVEEIRTRHETGNVLLVSHKATLRIITCALLGLDVRLFRERLAQPVAAVTLFVVTKQSAQLNLFCDRSHLSAELQQEEGT